jgi:3'-phosphoadenosine 5'-phosphosulfate sulfotransferase
MVELFTKILVSAESRVRNRVKTDWEKSIKEEKVRTGLQCSLRRRIIIIRREGG